jgi:hypothetical protein
VSNAYVKRRAEFEKEPAYIAVAYGDAGELMVVIQHPNFKNGGVDELYMTKREARLLAYELLSTCTRQERDGE